MTEHRIIVHRTGIRSVSRALLARMPTTSRIACAAAISGGVRTGR
ncbi:hypothetical protein [Gordonia metallireducens]|nr:hypothetical protein [Gordonia metallireducens]